MFGSRLILVAVTLALVLNADARAKHGNFFNKLIFNPIPHFNSIRITIAKLLPEQAPQKQSTLSVLGSAGPSITFDPHFLTAPGGLMGHISFNFNHYTV